MALPVLLRLVSLSGRGRDFPTKPEIGRQIASKIDFNVTSDYKRLERRLNAIERKQLPFAFSKTLNDAIFDTRKQIVDKTFPSSFDVRNTRFASASFRINKSSKRRLAATLEDKLDRGNLMLHAKGGTKLAKRGKIAIPSQFAKDTRSGRGVRKNLRPRQVIDAGKARRTDTAIWQRYGPKGRKQRLLYSLVPSAKIKKTFPFYDDATRAAGMSMKRNFGKNLRAALGSAR